MKRAVTFAIGVQVIILLLTMLPPLWVRATGTAVYLETEKMDPRDVIRGDYVVLGYKIGQGIANDDVGMWPALRRVVYVTVTTDRPARFVAVHDEPPTLQPGQACIVGRKRGWGGAVDFPQIAQFFVPEGQGYLIERLRGDDLFAKVATDRRCNAVLTGLEER